MVSPELLRRYTFFADLSMEHLVTLAQTAEEVTVAEGHYFFREEEELDHFYIVVEGKVGILVDFPDPEVKQPVSRQLTGDLITRQTVMSTIEPGEMFGWSALVPPHLATSSSKALTPCQIISFDCQELRQFFEEDCQFGYLMMLKASQVIRARLRDMRIESLSDMLTAGHNLTEPALPSTN